MAEVLRAELFDGLDDMDDNEENVADLSSQGWMHLHIENEISIDTLKLDNNQLSTLESLHPIINLRKLSVASNRLVKLSGIELHVQLRYLDLHNNSIFRINGLEGLTELEYLNLSNNNLTNVNNLFLNKNLRYIDLSQNDIEELPNLSKLEFLKVLFLQGNRISSLSKVSIHLPPQLQAFAINDNYISDLREIAYLYHLPGLQQLYINNNPFMLTKDKQLYSIYRAFAISFFDNIEYLDDEVVTEEDKMLAQFMEGERREILLCQKSELVQYLRWIYSKYAANKSQINEDHDKDSRSSSPLVPSDSTTTPNFTPNDTISSISSNQQLQELQGRHQILIEQQRIQLKKLYEQQLADQQQLWQHIRSSVSSQKSQPQWKNQLQFFHNQLLKQQLSHQKELLQRQEQLQHLHQRLIAYLGLQLAQFDTTDTSVNQSILSSTDSIRMRDEINVAESRENDASCKRPKSVNAKTKPIYPGNSSVVTNDSSSLGSAGVQHEDGLLSSTSVYVPLSEDYVLNVESAEDKMKESQDRNTDKESIKRDENHGARVVSKSVNRSTEIHNVDLTSIETDVINQDEISSSLEPSPSSAEDTNILGLTSVATKPKTAVFQSELELENTIDKLQPKTEASSFSYSKFVTSKDHAATVIQAKIKGFTQRKRYLSLLHQHKSAIKIQSYWRGYHTRQHNRFVQHNLKELRMRRLEDTTLRLQKSNNSLIVQLRSHEVQEKSLEQEVKELKDQMRKLQVVLATEDRKKRNQAAISIQKYWRGYQARKELPNDTIKHITRNSLMRHRIQRLCEQVQQLNHDMQVVVNQMNTQDVANEETESIGHDAKVLTSYEIHNAKKDIKAKMQVKPSNNEQNRESTSITNITKTNEYSEMPDEVELTEAPEAYQIHSSNDYMDTIATEESLENSDDSLYDSNEKTDFLTIIPDENNESDEDSLDFSIPVTAADLTDKSETNSLKDDLRIELDNDESNRNNKTEAATGVLQKVEDKSNCVNCDDDERFYRVPDNVSEYSEELEMYLSSVYKTTAEYTELILDKTLYDTAEFVDSTKICDATNFSCQLADHETAKASDKIGNVNKKEENQAINQDCDSSNVQESVRQNSGLPQLQFKGDNSCSISNSNSYEDAPGAE
ncbi:Centrosomal protein of 97 kDa [Trichoplax sp. H2]|nr:Centrosomal protein of 97 kDa [Trichoplax sp. H2]|eukprot:RDD45891.1 Centrosomal protein of 97 kDa [Trichoplax sp. H2]